MLESEILKRVMLAASRAKAVLFRNSVGLGFTGRSKRLRSGETYTARGGEVLIFDPRPLHAGLFKGSGDLVGWKTITITPDMVGQRVAVFVSTETKSAMGRLSADQKNWQCQIETAGGIAIVCRSAEEFTESLKKYLD